MSKLKRKVEKLESKLEALYRHLDLDAATEFDEEYDYYYTIIKKDRNNFKPLK